MAVIEWAKRVRRQLWTRPRMKKDFGSLPVEEAFRKIYLTKHWGGDERPFFSGAGSHGPVSDEYCAALTQFIGEHEIKTVLDLGCGDFSVGQRIVSANNVQYTGVDVVPELIDYHKQHVQDERATFLHANIVEDRLPTADLGLIRQVFQHLSNSEISKVLDNVRHLPRVLISEEIPDHAVSFNLDKSHGPDVRAYYGSGVYLDRPPFALPVKEIWTFRLHRNATLRTVLWEPASARK